MDWRPFEQLRAVRPEHCVISAPTSRSVTSALYRIVLVRLQWDQPTKDYVQRRTAEGKTKPEIIRCLKRYVAREIYQFLLPAARSTRT